MQDMLVRQDNRAGQIDMLLRQMEDLLANDYASALELGKSLIRLAETQKDPYYLAKTYTFVGIAYFRAANYTEASRLYELGLKKARVIADPSLEARCLNGLGLVYYQLGDYSTAIGYQLENLKVVQDNADHEGRIRALINIGLLHDQLDQADKALDYHEQALALAKVQNSLRYQCISSINVAGYYHDQHAYDKAIELYRETLKKIEESSEQALQGSLLLNLAKSLLEAGYVSEALEINAQALPVNQALGDRENECEVHLTQARLELSQKRFVAAEGSLNLALKLAQEIGVKRHIYEAHRFLSECFEAKQELAQALYHARCYHQLERQVHTEEVARKTKFLTSKAEAEKFKHEAEIERLRNVELALLNAELEQTKAKLLFQAEHDSLTGLANRALFEQRLQQATRTAQLSAKLFAVLFIDLDKFKTVNDSLGHDVGDELLIHVASRLKNCVRSSDLIARMGGDEFTILVEHLDNATVAQNIARKILAVLNSPFELVKQELYITASIGIALYPQDGMDASSLKKSADIAMYHVKYKGKNAFQMYQPSLMREVLESH